MRTGQRFLAEDSCVTAEERVLCHLDGFSFCTEDRFTHMEDLAADSDISIVAIGSAFTGEGLLGLGTEDVEVAMGELVGHASAGYCQEGDEDRAEDLHDVLGWGEGLCE